ncbi:MAG: hypothetical protein K2X82_28115 [Gemmataceae bacterium]|nr:hypothetical protein [Gemmataceae bacterium]
MADKRFRPSVEGVEARLAPAVFTPGVVASPPGFFGGPSLLVDFDRDLAGAAIPPGNLVSDQYAGLGVRFSLRGRRELPVTSNRNIVDAISAPNSLYVNQGERSGEASTLVMAFDRSVPGGRADYPTAVGFVFTDGPPGGFTARAFDEAGNLVDQAAIDTANRSFVPLPGDTEDTFIGLAFGRGIARVEVGSARLSSNGVVGYEIDNLRFNTPGQTLPPPPPPGGGPGTPGPGSRPPDLAVASANTTAQVFRVGSNDQLTSAFGPFSPFGLPGLVRGASGDVDGDGSTDMVFVTGPGGGGLIRVISGRTGTDLLSAAGGAFNAFPGENVTNIGLFVAVGDVTADGKAEIIVSPDRGGGPRVQIFTLDGTSLRRVANFFGIDDPNFRGGARVAAGSFDGDEFTDLVVAAGIGGGPRVTVFDGSTLANGTPRATLNFFVFEQTLRDGTYVGAGDLNGDGLAEMAFGGGPGGGPRVMVLTYAATLANPEAAKAGPLANFFAFDPNQRGGVRVAVKRVDGEDRGDLVVGSGDGATGAVRVYRGLAIGAGNTQDLPFGGGALATGVFVG